MKVRAKWVEGVSFVGESGTGHAVVIDGAPEYGGRNLGMRPMEMVLLGTGGCSAYDVIVILKKSGQEINGCSVELKAERAESDPKIFTRIHMHFVLRGKNLKTSIVESAIKLSHQKYCSASIMLGKTAVITHDYEIVADNLLNSDTRSVRDRITAYGLFIDPPLGRAGMTEEDIAGELDVSVPTVKRDWRKARAFLFEQLR